MLAAVGWSMVETDPDSIGKKVPDYALLPWTALLPGGGQSDRREQAEVGCAGVRYF